MTSFVHTNFATEHPGVARAEAVVAAVGDFRKSFDTTKSLATMLLAALVAALVVVADQLIDTWADGHLMAAWVALWSVAFVALALLAPTAKRAAAGLSIELQAWSRRAAVAQSEARYWESAQSDPRIMAELQAAILRSEETAVAVAKSAPARMSALKLGGLSA